MVSRMPRSSGRKLRGKAELAFLEAADSQHLRNVAVLKEEYAEKFPVTSQKLV